MLQPIHAMEIVLIKAQAHNAFNIMKFRSSEFIKTEQNPTLNSPQNIKDCINIMFTEIFDKFLALQKEFQEFEKPKEKDLIERKKRYLENLKKYLYIKTMYDCGIDKKTPFSLIIDTILQEKDTQKQKINYKLLKSLLLEKSSKNRTFINDIITKHGETALIKATRQNNFELIQFLLKNRANVHFSNKKEETPFSIIVNNILQESDKQKQEANYAILKKLLEAEADINARITKYGETALIKAVQQNNLDLVRVLLANNADVHISIKDKLNWNCEQKETAIHIAIRNIISTSPKNLNAKHYIILSELLLNRKQDSLEEKFTVDFKIPLIEAIEKAEPNDTLINLLLHYNIGINDRDENGNTPLSTALDIALKTNNLAIVRKLLQYKANPNIKIGNLQKTPLIIAISKGNFEMVHLLLKYNADVTIADLIGLTPLYGAFHLQWQAKNDIEKFNALNKIIIKLLEHKANPNIILGDYNYLKTPLMYAVATENLDLVKILINKYKADVNLLHCSEETPLCVAVRNNNNCKIALCLLEHGADLNLGCPLISAIKGSRLEMVKLLIHYKANVNISNKRHNTPLSCAIEMVVGTQDRIISGDFNMLTLDRHEQNLKIVRTLLECNADPNVRNVHEGWHNTTPIISAIKIKNQELIDLLLKHGADITKNHKDDVENVISEVLL